VPTWQRTAPLGDQAVMAYFEREADAFAFARTARSQKWPWLIDVVQAYRSVAVFYDLGQVAYAAASAELQKMTISEHAPAPDRLHVIPCCYDLGPDLERIGQHTGLTPAEVIALHTGAVYTVYAIGFCPGFPYLGYLHDKLSGVPRLETPRLKVEAGSVGLTGRQTGIYTEERPGGWNIVGRTPLQLVNVAEEYFPLQTGDQVRFEAIGPEEYRARLGSRLG
jgi:KipI family sensor histidine kinase inhibitor